MTFVCNQVQIHQFGDSFLSFRLEFGPRSLLTLLNLQKKLQIRSSIGLKIRKIQKTLVRFKEKIGLKFDREVENFSVWRKFSTWEIFGKLWKITVEIQLFPIFRFFKNFEKSWISTVIFHDFLGNFWGPTLFGKNYLTFYSRRILFLGQK